MVVAFQEVQDQIDWARLNIELGKRAAISYLQSDAFVFFTEDDPQTGDEIRGVRLVRNTPNDVKGPLRNAVVDIKHTFDMSLSAAAHALGFMAFAKNYPWADTPNGVKGKIKAWQAKKDGKLPAVIIDEIWRQQPYATGPSFTGGNDLVREVAKMANNKHTIGINAIAELAGYQVSGIFVMGDATIGDVWNPVKKEMVLTRVEKGGTCSYREAEVACNIFFEGAGRLPKISAIDVATMFADHAQACLEGFKAVCGV